MVYLAHFGGRYFLVDRHLFAILCFALLGSELFGSYPKCLTIIRYHEADMRTGRATYWQLTSLQAFWPGLQVHIGNSCNFLIWMWKHSLFFVVIRFLLGMSLLLTCHIVNFSMYGRNLEYYRRGIMFCSISILSVVLLLTGQIL